MADLAARVRQVLHEDGFVEAQESGTWGFEVVPGTTAGLVRVNYVRGSNHGIRESSVRFANIQMSEYVRVLQKAGFKVSRVMGFHEPDRLLVQDKIRPIA